MAESCYEKYLRMNPNGNPEDFQRRRSGYLKEKPLVGTPNMLRLPNGALVARQGVSASDVATMNGEAAKDSLKI